MARHRTLAAALAALITLASGHAGVAQPSPSPGHAPHMMATTLAATTLADAWRQRLAGQTLVQMSSYNSGGGGGGMSSRITIHLAADGRLAVVAESSVVISVPGAGGSSGGTTRASGTWRIYEENGMALIETRYDSGAIETSVLQANGTETFINGRRWFVVSP